MKKNALKLIFNPSAGGVSAASAHLEEAARKLTELGFNVDIVLAPRKRAAAAARKAVKQGYRLVVAMGGDGTIEAVASALVHTKARLGILPHGTYNNIAKSLGIPEDLETACLLLKERSKRRMDVGLITTRSGKRYFFEQLGVGLNAAVFPEIKDVHALDLEKISTAVKTFIGYKVPHFSLTLDGKSHLESDSLLMTAANTPAYGVTFLEAPGASLDDGLLEVCLYPGFSKAELVAYFALIMNGRASGDERVQRYRARKLVVRSDPQQEAVADNRVLDGSKVKARVLRKALRVVAPKSGGLSQETPPKGEALPAPVAPAMVVPVAGAQEKN